MTSISKKTGPLPYEERIQWFHQARFGLFVHWGLYSLLERGEWVFFRERIPLAEYEALAECFTGEAFDAEALVRLAVASGMKYAVLTTRHHEGFCLWDTRVTDFNSVQRSGRRDFVREFVDACRRHNLRVGLYISNKDWRQPGYWNPAKYPESAARMVDDLHRMVEELLTNYGRIDVLWFDGSWIDIGRAGIEDEAAFWRASQLLDRIYELQPHILVNNRLGVPGDLDTPEQHIKESQAGRGWEACMTIGDESAWGYSSHNPVRKSLGQLLRNLSRTAIGEGNFLLNTGPRGDGSIPEEDALLLRQVGDWLRIHGEAIYGSRRFDYRAAMYAQGGFTRQGNTLYLHVFRWSGEHLSLPLFKNAPELVTLLPTGQAATVERLSNGRLQVGGLPELPPHPCQTVLRLEFADEPMLLDEQDHAAWLFGRA